jgi:integrase
MPKQAKPLTARQVETRKKPGMVADGAGLYLLVSPAGTKSWIYRYQLAGKRRDMGLGPTNELSLAQARDVAREARRLVRDSIDPIEARRSKRAAAQAADATVARTFRQCAEAYVASHQAGWRSAKHRRLWLSQLETHVYPAFGHLPVTVINTALVTQALEPLWRVKPQTAGVLRGRIEGVLDWAVARGYRIGDNPARWRGHLQNLLPAPAKVRRVEHHAAMPYVELGAFMEELRQRGAIAARALEFLILAAARTGEVIGARWDEINLGERLWTLPADRMKSGREHRVPLSDAAMAIVDAMADTRQSDFIFAGAYPGRPLAHDALNRELHRLGRQETVHGFRSAFAQWAAERTNYSFEVRELALAHAVGDAVVRAYQRSDLFDRRRRLMNDWARFCAQPAGAGEVVHLVTPQWSLSGLPKTQQ